MNIRGSLVSGMVCVVSFRVALLSVSEHETLNCWGVGGVGGFSVIGFAKIVLSGLCSFSIRNFLI